MLHSDNNALILEKPTSWKMDSSVQPLVATTLHPSNQRPTGKYNSSGMLPNMGMLFDHLLSMIRSAHENRQYQPSPFPALWERTCTRLEKHKNATTYEKWKLTSILNNADELRKIDDEIADVWAYVQRTRNKKKHGAHRKVAAGRLKELRLKRQSFKPKAEVEIDGALEISIAFWIEARNAYNVKDEERALHSLLQCSFYLGTTHSPVTESEAQRGRRLATTRDKPRLAILQAAIEVIETFKVTRIIRHQETLCGEISLLIANDPKYSKAVIDFAKWNNKEPSTQEQVSERMQETLFQCAKGRRSGTYAEFKERLNQLFKVASTFGLSNRTKKVKTPTGW